MPVETAHYCLPEPPDKRTPRKSPILNPHCTPNMVNSTTAESNPQLSRLAAALLSTLVVLQTAHAEKTQGPLDASEQHYAAGTVLLGNLNDSNTTNAEGKTYFANKGDVIYIGHLDNNTTQNEKAITVTSEGGLTLAGNVPLEGNETVNHTKTHGTLSFRGNSKLDMTVNGDLVMEGGNNNGMFFTSTGNEQSSTTNIKAESIHFEGTNELPAKVFFYARPDENNEKYSQKVNLEVGSITAVCETGINTRGYAKTWPTSEITITGNVDFTTHGYDRRGHAQCYPNSGRVLALGHTTLNVAGNFKATSDFEHFNPVGFGHDFQAMQFRIAEESKVHLKKDLELTSNNQNDGALIDIAENSSLEVSGNTKLIGRALKDVSIISLQGENKAAKAVFGNESDNFSIEAVQKSYGFKAIEASGEQASLTINAREITMDFSETEGDGIWLKNKAEGALTSENINLSTSEFCSPLNLQSASKLTLNSKHTNISGDICNSESTFVIEGNTYSHNGALFCNGENGQSRTELTLEENFRQSGDVAAEGKSHITFTSNGVVESIIHGSTAMKGDSTININADRLNWMMTADSEVSSFKSQKAYIDMSTKKGATLRMHSVETPDTTVLMDWNGNQAESDLVVIDDLKKGSTIHLMDKDEHIDDIKLIGQDVKDGLLVATVHGEGEVDVVLTPYKNLAVSKIEWTKEQEKLHEAYHDRSALLGAVSPEFVGYHDYVIHIESGDPVQNEAPKPIVMPKEEVPPAPSGNPGPAGVTGPTVPEESEDKQPAAKPEATRGVAPVVEAFSRSRYLALTTLESLTSRQGQSEKTPSGLFVQLTHDRLALESASLKQHWTRARIGAEKAAGLERGTIRFGGDLRAMKGSSELGVEKLRNKLKGTGAALWTTYYDESGVYLDLLAGVDSLKSTVSEVNASARSTAWYGNVETGVLFENKAGWYVKPQLQGRWTRIGSASLGELHQDHLTSVKTRAGLEAGRRLETGAIVSVNVDAVKEWRARQHVTTAAHHTEGTLEWKGTHYEAGAAIDTPVTKSMSFHGDAKVRFGGSLKTRGVLNAALRWHF